MRQLSFDARFAERDVEVAFDVAPGETLALLGPNGAGKSTILNAVAGLLAPTSGSIRLGDVELTDLAPHRRRVAMLAQDPLLFPHLDAVANVAFGPRAVGRSKKQADEAARDWLDAVGVGELGERRPAQLSGGQAQRVAIARALAAEPDLVLLDEPFAAVDIAVRPALRQLLHTVLADRTTVMVTHDLLDALMVADRVLVLESGRVVETGPTAAVLKQPRSAFSAQLTGENLVAGTWRGGAVVSDDLTLSGVADDPAPADGAPAFALFAPTAVSVALTAHQGSPRNSLTAVVGTLEPIGNRIRVRTEVGDLPVVAEITPEAAAELALVPGQQVILSVKATAVSVYAGA